MSVFFFAFDLFYLLAPSSRSLLGVGAPRCNAGRSTDALRLGAPVLQTEDAAPVEPSGYDAISAMDSEPESITKWKAEQKIAIEAKDKDAKAKDEVLAGEAAKAMEEYEAKIAAARAERAKSNAYVFVGRGTP